MTFKFKHTLAVILAVVTVACSVVGTLAVSAAEQTLSLQQRQPLHLM